MSRGADTRDQHAARDSDLTVSGSAYLRAIGGGLLVGLPLLFTQEMWQHGFQTPWWKILLLLGVCFVVVLGYNSVSGFRRDRGVLEVVIDSVEAIGLGMVVGFVALLVLGRITADQSLRDAVGRVALESIPIAIGISLASTQLAAGGGGGGDGGNDTGEQGGPKTTGVFGRLFIAAGGALLFALNVAPTEEPSILGIEAPWWLLLLAMAASYSVTLAIVFYAEFRGGRPATSGDSPLERPLMETVAAYAIALLVALLLLWAFGRTEGAGIRAIAGQTVMLGIVAAFGAAAGRLLLGGGQQDQDGKPDGEEAAA